MAVKPGTNQDSTQSEPHTADKLRKPGSQGKGKDMPEDHQQHRTDPEEDYAKPDGTGPKRGLGGP